MYVRTARDLAAAVRGRRIHAGFSQSDLAERAGVSRKWVSEFEAGKSTVELAALLSVLEALGLVVDVSPGPAASVPRVDLDKLLGDYRRRP